jgi:hypothetical protein
VLEIESIDLSLDENNCNYEAVLIVVCKIPQSNPNRIRTAPLSPLIVIRIPINRKITGFIEVSAVDTIRRIPNS